MAVLAWELRPHLPAHTVFCLIEGYLLTGILFQDSSLLKQQASISVGTVGYLFSGWHIPKLLLPGTARIPPSYSPNA